jgi:ABC-2 type transport system ATP-binding protein
MTPFGVELHDLSVRFGATTAVNAVTATITAGTITGLLGRNASGKSTLLAAIAAFRRPTSGRVLVNDTDPYENPDVTAGITLVREAGDYADSRVSDMLQLAAAVRPTWSPELAEHLLTRFKLPTRKLATNLSRGQRSALGALMGLASRSPLTIFDEVYLGMDAPTRYVFYDELLTDYTVHPRTIVISSHLIEEVERLFEHVLILDEGRLLLSETAEGLRERGRRLSIQDLFVSMTGDANDDVSAVATRASGTQAPKEWR